MADGGGDHLTSASSVSPSDEEEKVVEEVISQTPEIPQVTYTNEELEKLVGFVQRMSVLFALDHKDWSEQTVDVIKKWLCEVQHLMLVVFYDGTILTACLTFPLSPVQDLAYFLREPNQIFTVDGFHDEVVFGTIHEDIDGTLLSVLEKVYAPIFFQYQNWNENIKSHLCSCLHDFLSFLTGLHYKLSGMTVLYIPNEGHALPLEVALKDREMIKRLEIVAVYWASQIRMCLSDKTQLVPYDLLCPFDEFDFWLYRYEVLQGLNAQLNHSDLLRIVKLLTNAQSVYIKQISELKEKCTNEITEAKSNITYLQLLDKPCKNLDQCDNPAKVPHLIPKIVHIFRYIWLKSEYFNTKDSIEGLFRALSNQIIIYCRNKVNISHVLNGNPRFGIKMADMSIDCCLSYKAIYNMMSKKHAIKNPAVGWDLNKATIFNHVDAFVKRLEDLIDICESMIVFGRMDETETIEKPLFGGNRGVEFERTIDEVESIFQEGLVTLKNNSIDVILDVHNKQWYKDLEKYRNMVREIEDIVQNLISNVFLSVCNVDEGIDALASLYYFSYRGTLRSAYIRQTSEVWNMFTAEIADTNTRMLEQSKERPSWLPKYASKAIALKINLDRITHIKDRFKAAAWMPDVSQATMAMGEYNAMHSAFTKNIQKVFDKWIEDIGFEFLSKLERPLMVRSETHEGLLECNIDRNLLDICEEARYFEILGFTIPVNVNQVYSKYRTIKLIYESVVTVVLDYNKILSTLSNEERKLFKTLIMTCDKKISPGLSKLTWGGEFSDAYIAECVEHTGKLQGFVDLYKAANDGVAEVCEKICNTPVLKLTTSSVTDLKDLVRDLEEFRSKATVQLMEHYNLVVDFIVAVYRGFETSIRFMAQEWYDYILKFDGMMQEALVICARNSLYNIYSALHGDGSVGPSPILSMTVDILHKQLVFSPKIEDITQILGGLLNSVVEAIALLPRITEKLFPDLEDHADAYEQIISDDPECLKVQENILDEIAHNERELKFYLDTWLSFRAIWELNKDEFMQKYEETDTPAHTFDANIGRYTEVANQVSMQETISTVYFIVVNSNSLKDSILTHIEDWQSRHTELLKRKARDKITNIYNYMETNRELISTVPKSIEDMRKSVILFEKLSAEVAGKEAEFPSIIEHFQTLDKYEVLISAKTRTMLRNLDHEWKDYVKKLKEAEDMLGTSKDDFKLSLLKQADVLREEAQELLDDFLEKAPTSSPISCPTAFNILEEYHRKMIELSKTEKTLIGDLSVFHMNQPENTDLKKLDKELTILDEIWDLVEQWETNWENFKSCNFWEIVLDDMENFAVTLYRRLNRLCKQYQDREWDILEHTRKLVDDFRRTLPLILALKNPAMRSRHWDRVRSLVKMNFDENAPDFNLESIIAMDFQAYSEDIQDVSNTASMELQIENGVKNIADIWETMAFEIVPFKAGIYRIKSVDDCFQVLEENVVQISTMKATRFVEPFAKEVDYWEKTLSYIMESLEHSLNVQRQWLYLENIFIGDDIKKQLPKENAQFEGVTREWQDITCEMYNAGTALRATHFKPPNYLLEKLTDLSDQLELIQRALEVYLEKKRQIFPRFYFISNDDLLEILGNSKKPDLIQTHMKKLFDNLYKLKLDKILGKRIRWEAHGMFSDDGEYVDFLKPLLVEGPSEIWLGQVEREMRVALRDKLRLTRNSLKKLLTKRDKWLPLWPGQMCLTSSQIQWTSDCTRSLMLCKMVDEKKPLKKLKKKQNQVLDKLSEMSRKEQPKQIRLKVNTLITIEIHGRDVIERMYKSNCKDVSHFEWFSQLRFYWDREHNNCIIRQTNTENFYGYEYTGNSGRLVITPLTDRCYITLTTALHLHRGGSPKGPAGTGKTETVKDLGKALGMWVIVTNCSEGLDYRSIGKNFSGLAQTGCWGCFDEFNRINVEVLSVVAQQILSILSALSQKLASFNFEGEFISIKPTVGLFITMNPGYAGRTELPDNLKSMFRPISMIVPDNVIIAENLLFSDGFQNTKNLARKVFTLYELAKQQLSKQSHYDFGLRSMVALLRYAGLKRRQLGSSSNEEEVVYLAMKDMNMARLTANDLPLFVGIILDIFPGVIVPSVDYREFKTCIESELLETNLQVIPAAVGKVIELFETKNSRHSVMVLGDTGTAKSTTWKTLQGALGRMKKLEKPGWDDVVVYPINPKALNLGELYGEYNLATGEWLDGVLSAIMRQICADESSTQKWILFDGPVDAVWIENMNSVMDDNKVLTLVNSERITMPAQVSLLFEVADLAVASPATVSRCGMVYNDYNDWGWRPYVRSWLQKQSPPEYVDHMSSHFNRYLDKVLDFKRRKCRETVETTEINCVISLCRLLDCLATKENGITIQNDELLETMSKLWFLFCLIWSVCGTVDEEGRLKIDNYLRELEGVFPIKDTVYDYYVDPNQRALVPWEDKLSDNWRYDTEVPFYKVIVPTVDTVRYEFLVSKLLSQQYPVMLVGPVGTGKSSTAVNVTDSLDKEKYSLLALNMSAQTTANNLQDSIESRTEKRTKDVFVPIGGKSMICFMDDFNLPAKDTYGSQPPLELIRQWIDYAFWYNRKTQKRVYIKQMLLMVAMGPPGGGRTSISRRTMSRFSVINMTFPTEDTITRIFGTMLKQKLADFPRETKQMWKTITSATLELYMVVSGKMLPTPAKIHYLFNLRDISKVFQGMLRIHHEYHKSRPVLLRLWLHECFRVFSDRLVDSEDLHWFQQQVSEILGKAFDTTFVALCPSKSPPIFGDFLSKNGYYEDLIDMELLRKYMLNQLEDYNNSPGVARLDLVFFKEAMEHITRIVRVISQRRGNMLIIAIGGSGRQVLSKLAAYMAELNTFQIEVTKKYHTNEFREDLKLLYKVCGVKNRGTSFLFTGEQVVELTFLEILNNVLSTGEINLFKPDEFEEIKTEIEPRAKKHGIHLTTDALYSFFMETVRENLHVIVCLSPVGAEFRAQIRQYPALINNTTVNWFRDWPQEALLEVAQKFLGTCNLDADIFSEEKKQMTRETMIKPIEEKLQEGVAMVCSEIHSSVVRMAETMQKEMKRHYYVTPVNYLELVSGFQALLHRKRNEVSENANRLRTGLSKIEGTQGKVTTMSHDLKESQEQVIELQIECEEFLGVIQAQAQEADEQRKEVEAKAKIIETEKVAAIGMAEQAQEELNKTLPAFEAAIEALDSLNKRDLTELKSYGRPSYKIEKVVEAVMILLGKDTSWTEARKVLGEQNFLNDLKNFDKDHISDKTLKRIAAYTQNPELEPEKVAEFSLACKSFSIWIRAIEHYAKVYRVVAPKKAAVDQAMSALKAKEKLLQDAEKKLAELDAKLEKLKTDFNEKSTLQDELKQKAENLRIKVERALLLVESLAGNRERWIQTVKKLDTSFGRLVGDCLVAAAFICYVGPFDTRYRSELVEKWRKEVQNHQIPNTDDFEIVTFLCDPVTIREWNIQGLPSDDFSTENGILVTQGARWPLIIDPQTQAQIWIKKLEKKNLKIIDFGQTNYIKTLEMALQHGNPVLLQNVAETLDPALNPILKRAVIFQGGQKLIKFNDKLISYNSQFRFYVTTKLSNPHYAPEICTKTTLVNFAIKESGLKAQLLAIIVRKERPVLEEQKDNLVMTIAKNRRTLINLDNEILRLLNESRGSILDDDELFSTLQISKQTAVVVAESLSSAEVTEMEIDQTRQGYQPAAHRAAILFFVLMDMSRVDPMYQFSLNAYVLLFTQSIEKSVKNPNLGERISNLNDFHTFSVYNNTCRGLFERHKLLFSSHMCARIAEAALKLNKVEFDFLLKGGTVLDRQGQTPNPWPQWITETAWDNITELDKVAGFHGIANSFEQYPREWKEWYSSPSPEKMSLVGDWKDICNDFQKMLIVRCLRPDRMTFCMTTFIVNVLGPKYVEPPMLDLKAVLNESLPQTPLIFVLSPGVDPTSALIQLAEASGMSSKIKSLSLGQGQAPIATKMLAQGAKDGVWVFLANCHLSLSWMPQLDKLVEMLQSGKVHRKFRLWLSSSPHPEFPISILQAGIKMTTEPPSGIKANMKRLYNIITEDQFTRCEASDKYKKLLFSLCFFHTVLLERKKFQQLGWNVIYSFNDSDFEVSENLLTLYLNEYKDTPWDALKYLIAGVNYGGHVTDDWDRRLLTTYINQFFNDDALTTQDYRLSSLTTYYIPREGVMQSYLEHIQLFPNFDKPEAFGQHPNADIASQITETRDLFETLVSLQGQSAAGDGESKEVEILKLAHDIETKIPDVIDYENTSKLIGPEKQPLDVVLLQEIERYNALLINIKQGLSDLQKGIKGLVVMSAELEDMYSAVFEGKVPSAWLRTYASLKPLGSWARDLVKRIEYFSLWAKTVRPPVLFWLAAYTFPTGFLTAVLQTCARITKTPIDELSWEFTVMVEEETASKSPPHEGGVYIRGFFLEGAGWDRSSQCLQEPQIMELISPMPVIQFNPVENLRKRTRGIYQCPCYYYSIRAGSFIIAVDLNAGYEDADFWIRRGTALLLSLPT